MGCLQPDGTVHTRMLTGITSPPDPNHSPATHPAKATERATDTTRATGPATDRVVCGTMDL
jgi:hypothetical protein